MEYFAAARSNELDVHLTVLLELKNLALSEIQIDRMNTSVYTCIHL